MALYRESPISGSTYRRAFHVIMENSLNKLPKVFYIEEDVVILSNNVITTTAVTGPPLGGVVNANGVIELRDVVTKEPTGQYVPASLVYAALYSDYINRAEARDAAEAALLAQSLTVNTSAEVSVVAPDAAVVEE